MAKSNAKPAQPPVALNPKPPVPITVGLRVEANTREKGKPVTVYGVIKSIRKDRAVMVMDGGEKELSGPLGAFRPSSHPLPKDEPNLMDRWDVVKYRGLKVVDEPGGYNAEITLDGKPVIQAYNQGTGGPDNFQPLKGTNYSIVAQLEKDAVEWAKLFYPDAKLTEVTGLWVTFKVFHAKYGCLAKDFLKSFITSKEDEERWKKQREDEDRAEREKEKAVADKLGVKVLLGRDESRELKLPPRFQYERVTNYAVLVDTTTGRGVHVGLCDLGGAIKALAALFPDEPKAEGPITQWGNALDAKRMAKAEAIFQEHELDGFAVAEMNGWETHPGNRWTRVWFAENPDGGDTIRKTFAVQFAPGTEEVMSARVEG